MQKYYTWLSIITFGTITACNVVPKYERPKIDLPTHYRNVDSGKIVMDSLGINQLSWKKYFKDSLLIQLIDSTLQHNWDMRTSLNTIEIAEAKLKQSKANFFPSITANTPNLTRTYSSHNSPDGAKTTYYNGQTPPKDLYVSAQTIFNGFSASWEPDIWGKIRGNKDIANNSYLQSFEARKLIQSQLVTSVAQSYYTLIALDQQLKVARMNRDLSDSTLKIISLLRAAGEETSLALEQTQSQKQLAEALIPKIENDIALQENQLRFLSGNLPDTIYRSASLNDSSTYLNMQINYPLSVLANRPDVRNAELALRTANDSVGVAQSYRYPTLTFGMTGGINTVLPKNWFDIPGSLFGSIIGSLTTPIFQKRTLRTNWEVAKLNRNNSEINFQKTVYNAINETTNAIISIQKIREQLDIAHRQVTTASTAVKHAFLLFKSGYEDTDYLQVITAMQALLNSQLSQVNLNVDFINAKISLYKALGGGWK